MVDMTLCAKKNKNLEITGACKYCLRNPVNNNPCPLYQSYFDPPLVGGLCSEYLGEVSHAKKKRKDDNAYANSTTFPENISL